MFDKFDLQDDNSIVNIIVDGIIVGILLLFIILILLNSKLDNNIDESDTEPKIKVATIRNLYRSNDEYYMEVMDISSHLYYDVKITKSDFMRYKTNDIIYIKVFSNKAYIYHDY